MLPGSQFSFGGAGHWVCAKLPRGEVGGCGWWKGKQGSLGSQEVWGEGEQNKSGSSAGVTAQTVGANIPPLAPERNEEIRGQLEQRWP